MSDKEKLQFPTVVLKAFSRNKTGGHAVFTSTFPKSIGDQMGWNGFPAGATSVKLEGELHATSMTLTPKEGPLSKWKVKIEISSVSEFQALRLESEGTRDKGHRIELRFGVAFADREGCSRLEEYMTNVGAAKASLDVSYTKQAEQSSLIGDDTPSLDEVRRQATLAEND